MILSALNSAYRRLSAEDGPDALPPFGFAVAKVAGAVMLDGQGRFLDLLDLRSTEGKRLVPQLMAVPQPPQRPGKGVSSGFLYDNGGYLLGYDGKDKPERVREKFTACRDRHQAILGGVDDPLARAVLAHFARWDADTAAERLAGKEELAGNWLVFLILDAAVGSQRYAHEAPALRDAWARHAAAAAEGATEGQCLVTGETGPIARLHPPIKGVGKAKGGGAPLVSFNIAASTSYGKDQSFNAPVGEVAAFGYTTALNHLLRPDVGQVLTIGDTTVVVWAERASKAEALVPALLEPSMDVWSQTAAEDEGESHARVRAGDLRAMLADMRKGLEVTDPDLLADEEVAFHVLGLSLNVARLSVRIWDVATVAEMLTRLRDHHHDLALVVDHPKRPLCPSLWILAQETRPKDGDGKARGANSLDSMRKLHGDIARAVLTGQPYPRTIPALLMARFRADGHVTHPRAALLKAEYNRRRRLAGHPEEMIPMALDRGRTEVGYCLGRLFSVLEHLQNAAHGGSVNAGIGQKFLSSASATPQTVFPHLLRLKGAHLKKVARERRGRDRWYEGLFDEILEAVESFPATLSPDQQGLFFVGYYHQRQDLFRSKSKDDPAAAPDENPEAEEITAAD